MNKAIQIIGGFIIVVASIASLAYMFISVSVKNTEEPVSTIKPPSTEFLNDDVISKLKTLNLPQNVPVRVSPSEVSKENPFRGE